jgi:AraC-like DNA-binding protein
MDEALMLRPRRGLGTTMLSGRNIPLDQFSLIRTRDPDEAQHILQSTYGVRTLDLLGHQESFNVHANYYQLQNIGMSYCSYGTNVRVGFPCDDIVYMQFGINGRAEIALVGDRLQMVEGASCLIPAYAGPDIFFGESFEQLVLRFKEPALRKKLGAMVGADLTAPVQFAATNDLPDANIRFLRQYAFNILSNLQTLIPEAGSLVVAEIEEVAFLALLTGSRHNYSYLLDVDQRPIGPWQVRNTIEYIESNWSRPLEVETIAAAIGASSRSIFKTFRAYTGYSPMVYLKKVRLREARKMLLSPNGHTSVMGVALNCGFQNPGHFAREYHESFGELPSSTLSRSKGPPRP